MWERELEDLANRQALPCGYGRGLPTIESRIPPKPDRTLKEMKTIAAYAELKRELIEAIDRLIGCDRSGRGPREKCSGNTPIWYDDPDGASGSWGAIVRAYEDLGEIIF